MDGAGRGRIPRTGAPRRSIFGGWRASSRPPSACVPEKNGYTGENRADSLEASPTVMDVFRRLKRYYWPFRRLWFASILCGVLMTLLGLVRPLLLQAIIDRVLVEGKYAELAWWSLAVIGVAVARGTFQYLRSYLGHLFGSDAVFELRNSLYRRLQSFSFGYYDKAKTGDLMARLAGDVEAFRMFLAFGFAHLLDFTLLFLLGLGVMLYLDWSLTLIVLITMPFLGYLTARFHVRVHPAFTALREAMSELSTVVQENITGVRTVKSFAQERQQINHFARKVAEYIDRHMAATSIWTRYFPAMELMGNIGVLLLLWVGGRRVISGTLSVGELAAFFSYIWYIVHPLQQLGYQINNLTQSIASGQRLLEILDTPREIKDEPGAVDIGTIRGEVTFENVSFSYSGELDDQAALKGIDLHVPAGSVVGILGPTGSGKSTLVSLIPRYYDVTAGRVLVDGVDVRKVRLDALRRQVAIVFQETFLFSTSIRENISYGRRDATFEEIVAAAKSAKAHDFIMELPDGYDTLVGERGLGLSGGQKQRIAIARALLADPRILILDDATASVDMETEHEIQEALAELMKGRTTFIIAHRISSVKDADQIIVLDKGRIVERGTHRELLARNGHYRYIYDVQFKDHVSILRSLTEAAQGGGLAATLLPREAAEERDGRGPLHAAVGERRKEATSR